MKTDTANEAAADKLRLLVAVCGAAQEGAPLRRAAKLVSKAITNAERAYKELSAPVSRECLGMMQAFGERVMRGAVAELEAAKDRLTKFKTDDVCIPTRRFFIEELEQVQREFADVRVNSGNITVRTEPITLEYKGISVDLGRFDLIVEFPRGKLVQRKGSERIFGLRISAVEPNPAFDHADVTHPHVRGELLCEGEAAAAIRYALDEGRLADVFSIVDRTLHTYNPSSPYAKLNRWTAIVCPICGTKTLDVVACSDCGDQVCPACVARCSVCNNQACKKCIGTCECCGEVQVCDGCGHKCSTGCSRHKRLCEHCATKCHICEKELCCHCLRRCHLCGAPVCEDHRVLDGEYFTCRVCKPDETLKASRQEYPEEGDPEEGGTQDE